MFRRRLSPGAGESIDHGAANRARTEAIAAIRANRSADTVGFPGPGKRWRDRRLTALQSEIRQASRFVIEGRPIPAAEARPGASIPDRESGLFCFDGYSAAQGPVVHAGRLETSAVTVINQTMARRFWPDGDFRAGESIWARGVPNAVLVLDHRSRRQRASVRSLMRSRRSMLIFPAD